MARRLKAVEGTLAYTRSEAIRLLISAEPVYYAAPTAKERKAQWEQIKHVRSPEKQLRTVRLHVTMEVAGE